MSLSAPWWEVAGRTALAGALGLPGLAFVALQLLRYRSGAADLRTSAPTLAVATFLLAVAWLVACGRTRLAGVLLAAYGAYLAARLAGVGDPVRRGDTVAIHLLAAVLGIAWIVGREDLVRRRTLLPVRSAATGMSIVCLAAAPSAAAEIGRLLGSAWEPASRPAVVGAGDAIPAVRLATLAGEPVSLREPRVVYIVSFWATWCAPCLLELPEIAVVARRAAGDRTVRFLAVNTEELAPERLRTFLESRGLGDLPAGLDPEGAWRKLGVRSLPLTLVVQDARVVRRFEGYRRGVGVEVEREIARLRRRREAERGSAG